MDCERELQEYEALSRMRRKKAPSALGRFWQLVATAVVHKVRRTLAVVRDLLPWDTLDLYDAVQQAVLMLLSVLVAVTLLSLLW